MDNIIDKFNIDPENKIEREIDGCKVRLFFNSTYNEKIERSVLDNLLLVFERKQQEMSSVQT